MICGGQGPSLHLGLVEDRPDHVLGARVAGQVQRGELALVAELLHHRVLGLGGQRGAGGRGDVLEQLPADVLLPVIRS